MGRGVGRGSGIRGRGSCRIHITENISRIIINIFKERLHVMGYNWKMVPHDIKDFYWQEFQV